MRSMWLSLLVGSGVLTSTPGAVHAQPEPSVKVVAARVPDAGLQPRAARSTDGTVHLVYFKGDLEHGDVMYARRAPGAAGFAPAVRVNSQPKAGAAAGTIRGPALAVEPGGRVHVVWCGADDAVPRAPLNPSQAKDDKHNGTPLLYARSDKAGNAFEPQRNLMTATWALDGGPAVAADTSGNISVVWHAGHAKGTSDEAGRGVFLARSTDHGAVFSAETRIEEAADGACACCGISAGTDPRGRLAVLYRRAKQNNLRDMMLLLAGDKGETFSRVGLDPWEIRACPMTTSCVVADGDALVIAWETKGQVSVARVDPAGGKVLARASAQGDGNGRKYPSVAVGRSGRVLLTWADGAGWGRGGSVAWQVFDRDLKPVGKPGRVPAGLAAWTFPAPYADGDGFVVLY